MPPVRRSPGFESNYQKLTSRERRLVEAKLALLSENHNHPSLRAAKWQQSNLWYARISRDIRVFYEIHDGYYLLMAVGHHDIERGI